MQNLLPLLVLAGFGFRLSAVDLKVHRLPNHLVGWFTVTQIAVLIAINLGNLNSVGTSLLVAGASTATYLILFIVSRGALGMGDVKFAFPLGLTVGWYCSDLWLIAIFISFLGAGIVATIGLMIQRINRSTHIAFGPYMYVGTFIACCVGILPQCSLFPETM